MLTMFAEVRKNEVWHKVDKEFASTYEELDGILTDRVYDGHDRKLIDFLKEQCHKGVPDQVSSEIKKHKFFQDVSIWYATLGELLDFNWEKETYKTGYISDWQYKRLRENGINPVNVRMSTPYDALVVSPFMAELIDKYPELNKEHKRVFVIYKYDFFKFYETQEFFCDISIPELIDLIPEDGDVNDVRIIFSVR